MKGLNGYERKDGSEILSYSGNIQKCDLYNSNWMNPFQTHINRKILKPTTVKVNK